MSRRARGPAPDPPDGHWSRDPTFEVNARVRLRPTPSGPIEPADLKPIENLLGARLELEPEQLEELRALGVGIDEWLRQDEGNSSSFLENPGAGIEAAVAAGFAAPLSDDLQKAFEEAARHAKPRAVRAGADVETTVLPFSQERGDGGS